MRIHALPAACLLLAAPLHADPLQYEDVPALEQGQGTAWLEYGIGYGWSDLERGVADAPIDLVEDQKDDVLSRVSAGFFTGGNPNDTVAGGLFASIDLWSAHEAFPLAWSDNEPDFRDPELARFDSVVGLQFGAVGFTLAYDRQVFDGLGEASDTRILLNGATLAVGDRFRTGYTYEAVRVGCQFGDAIIAADGTPRGAGNAALRLEAGYAWADVLGVRETTTPGLFEAEAADDLSGPTFAIRGGIQSQRMTDADVGVYLRGGADVLLDADTAYGRGVIEVGLIGKIDAITLRAWATYAATYAEPYGSDDFATQPLALDVQSLSIGVSAGFEF